MPISVNMTFETLEEMFSFYNIKRMPAYVEDSHPDNTNDVAEAEPSTSAAVESGASDEVQTTKRKRRTKAEMEAERQTSEATDTKPEAKPEAKQANSAKTLTKDDARNKLGEVNAKKGLQAAREILSNFGATSVSGLKDEEYGAFIAKCEEAIASE